MCNRLETFIRAGCCCDWLVGRACGGCSTNRGYHSNLYKILNKIKIPITNTVFDRTGGYITNYQVW